MKKILKPFVRAAALILVFTGITRLFSRRLAFAVIVRLPQKYQSADSIVAFRGVKLKVNAGDSMGRVLKFMDPYKPVHTALMESLLVDKKLFYDIGAHIGLYSAMAVKRGVRTVSIEPDPALCQYYIRPNVVMNGPADLATVLCKAVSDTKGTATFWMHRMGNLGSGRLFKAEDMGENPTIVVETDTLDNLVQQYGKPDLMKVHIEGAEVLMLRGSYKVFEGEDAPTIVIEFHLPDIAAIAPGTSGDDLIKKLLGFGYKVKTITEPKYKESMWHVFYKRDLSPASLALFAPETQVPGGYFLNASHHGEHLQ
ncbi:MAG: hypothetical protein A3A33_01495 [Candidatus Yanofskybacteria bacterium RIFCSPLOWO2_01_FULL_49_25]|uniref:Methyltransferase FkbM domain-containing protein n=1 Tax=Candidatus Yanofskybacteria bacterium RIFCSPLOWO2_01_FULL_49_25 TaxID=1802701 RepID=A0A1F8GZA3_9BACT|nr:MAG: hypothetical protein A3A33_01495 [Candidatus Yanofskybacteria bacterium RIFCSPLOWO2_01_FULL_49_25]